MSMVLYDETLDGETRAQTRRERWSWCRVAHEARVHALVRALLEKDDFASAALLACTEPHNQHHEVYT